MTMHGHGESLCQEAREHYYDFLCGGGEAVPEAIARHIENCPFCRQEILRLGDAIHRADDPSRSPTVPAHDAVVEALSRQFEWLGEQVRCSHAKPFLPELSAPSQPIRIPTPVTVHVENCPQCAKDLAAIGRLSLAPGQLKRLGEFLRLATTADLPPDTWMPTTTALASFSFDESRPEDLNRVCCCPRSRKWVYERRACVAAGLEEGTDRTSVLGCDEVSTSDLFDFVLPFGLDAEAIRRATGRRDAVGTHVRRCRACLERVQSLHRTVYGIAERADTEVGTIYRCEKNAGDASHEEAGTPHRYPVDVWIVQNEPAKQSRVRLPTKPVFLAGSVSLVAIIVLATVLSFTMSAAKGTNFTRIEKSVRQSPNVYLKFITEGEPNSVYETWVSRELNQYAMRSRTSSEVTDLNRRTRIVIDQDGRRHPPMTLKGRMLDQYRLYMDQENLFADAPGEEELSEVADDGSDPSAPRRLMYEIARNTVTPDGNSIQRRWRVFLDPTRNLPTKAEFSRRDSQELPWERTGTIELAYPTKAEMENVFRELAQAKWPR
jgi:hypothetical protein